MEVNLTWEKMKEFYDEYRSACYLTYLDLGKFYIVVVQYLQFNLTIDNLKKGTIDCEEFETSYKALANPLDASKARIVTCKFGRRLHDRFISFTTAKDQTFDNTDWREIDYDDLTYTMKDINGDTTTVDVNAKETWIDINMEVPFEIQGGQIYQIDPVVSSTPNADQYEIHVVGAPNIPAAQGGDIHFVANPRIKFLGAQGLYIDAALNPSEIDVLGPYGPQIRIVMKHPLGAQREYQLRIRIFK